VARCWDAVRKSPSFSRRRSFDVGHTDNQDKLNTRPRWRLSSRRSSQSGEAIQALRAGALGRRQLDRQLSGVKTSKAVVSDGAPGNVTLEGVERALELVDLGEVQNALQRA